MQNDPTNTPDPEIERDDGLTEAERAELEADAASGGAPTGEQPAPGPAADQPPAAPAAAADEPDRGAPEPDPRDATLAALAQTQAQTVQTLAAVAERLGGGQEQPRPPAGEEPPQPTEPDWEAQKAELRQRLDDGDLDDDQYELERERLLEKRAEWIAEQRAAKLIEERLERQQKEALDRQWDEAVRAFNAVEANAKFLQDPVRLAAFNAVLGSIAQERPDVGYSDMLTMARDRTMQAFNMTPPDTVDPKRAVAEAIAKRQPAQVPPDLSRAPAAGFDNERGTNEFDALDDMNIDQLENELARKPEDWVERFLESAPGGLLDNPRG